MAKVGVLLSEVYSKITLFLSFSLLELIVVAHSLSGTLCKNITGTRSRWLFMDLEKLIEQKNPTLVYHHHHLGDNIDNTSTEDTCCSVCLSNFEQGDKLRKLQCNHTFHKDCLDKWLHTYYATCPLCRHEVLPEEIAAKHRARGSGTSSSYYDQPFDDEASSAVDELVLFLSAAHGHDLDHRL